MDNYFINSGIISIIFVLLKFAEMKIILKEDKPLKVILRDGIFVYLSSVLGMFLIDQLDNTTSSLSSAKPT
jgi:hypothetical protein